MAQVTERDVMAALSGVTDPDRGSDVASLGMVSGLVIKDGNVGFALEVAPERGPALEPLRQAAEKAVFDLPGVNSATVVLTAHSKPSAAPAAPPPPQAQAQRAQVRGQQQGSGRGQSPLPDGVKAVVAVASGKGGVGKSTTAVNLALALSASGLKVGILDADIYGPSLPRMMGITERPTSPDGKTLLPMERYGIECMSIGFLVPEDTPTIWRGPMVMSALEQMMRDVAWSELDVMVVDMPPGTGDAQLTMSQRVPLAGAVIVSTPQDIALLDARKGLNMFRKVDVPVLGIVENMSLFICPHCGGESHIFGHGGAKAEADTLGVDFLGEVPLHMSIRETSDGGTPIVATDPEGPYALAYKGIAEKIVAKIGADGAQRAAPKISFV